MSSLQKRECELGRQLYDTLAIARHDESFVFSPRALYASALIAAAAGNDEMIRQILGRAWTPRTLAEELAALSYDSDRETAPGTELERRFPIEHALTLDLQAPEAARLAPQFLNLVRAVGVPVQLEAATNDTSTTSTSGLGVHSDFRIAGPWYDQILGERTGVFHGAGDADRTARYTRIQGIEDASVPEDPSRAELYLGMGDRAHTVILISLKDGQPSSFFCGFPDPPGELQNVVVEIPEASVSGSVSASESSGAFEAPASTPTDARYSCAYEPDPREATDTRARGFALTTAASLSFTKAGLSWNKPGPQPSDYPPPRLDIDVPVKTYDLKAPPRTLTFDGPFQFAVVSDLGLIEAVGRVSRLPPGDPAQ